MDLKSILLGKKAMNYAVKSSAPVIKDVDLSKKIVTGFYNSYNFFDSDQDVLLMGCAAKSIADRGPASKAEAKIKHLIDHDWGLLPGKIITLDERTVDGVSGNYFETKMSGTQLGTDTLINYQEGIYDNHSIGFQYLKGEYIEKGSENWDKYLAMLINPKDADECGYMFTWEEIKQWEGSTVAFGANSLTPYLGVKSMNKEALALKVNQKIELLEKQLRGGTQSDESMQGFEMQVLQLKQLISELFTLEPSVKDTLKKGRTESDTQPVKKSRFGKLSSIS